MTVKLVTTKVLVMAALVSAGLISSTNAEAAGRNCGVSVGGVGMPHGVMAVPPVGIAALESRGYTEESSYHADLFLWVEVNCILGPLGSICTPTAVLKDIITKRELTRATGVLAAAFGVSAGRLLSIEFFPATFGWKELDCGNENKRVKN
jgi:hypothetical protein